MIDMAGKPKDITGCRYGLLTAVKPTDKRCGTSVIWECLCDCGEIKEVSANNLRRKTMRPKSCGCLSLELSRENIKIVHDKYIKDDTSLLQINKRGHSNTGVKGVSRQKNGKYRADIYFQHKKYFLGRFDDLEDAIHARKEAEAKYFKPIVDKYLNPIDK